MVNSQYDENAIKKRYLELEIRLKQAFENNKTHTRKFSENQ